MENRVALVTGASKGIGKAIALRLAQCGYDLFLLGRDTLLLKQLSTEIQDLGVRCHFVSRDLSLADNAKQAVHDVIEVYGYIDLVINNAGYASSLPIDETSVELWDKTFAVNARAPFLICKAAVSFLKNREQPIIINIGSVVGFKGYIHQAAYASSKHALMGFTKVFAKEVHPLGIGVFMISPGGVNTEMVQEMRPDIDTSQLIQPNEIADIVEFIISRKGKGVIDHFYIRRESSFPFG